MLGPWFFMESTKFVQIILLGDKWPHGHLYVVCLKTNSCLEPLGLEYWFKYVAPPSGPLPSLFKLWTLGQKWSCPRSLLFYIE